MNTNLQLRWLALLIMSPILFSSCAKDPAINNDKNYTFAPEYFPKPVYQKVFNQEEFDLGKALFYDPILSSDSSISCASCHAQVHAFADHGAALSEGVNGKIGLRNSTALFNLIWMPTFMADGGITHIEIMPLAPLTDTLEMNNSSMLEVINRLNDNKEYTRDFKKVYQKEKIDDQQLFLALAQFMASLNSFSSKYDKVMQEEAEFTPVEQEGYELFLANCNSCHTAPLFTNYSYQNNGLKPSYTDNGRFRITRIEKDRLKFKVPSLRNIHLTRPYLHDGSVRELQELVERYRNPFPNPSLSPMLQNGIKLTDNDVDALLSFLGTLNDYEFTSNTKLAHP